MQHGQSVPCAAGSRARETYTFVNILIDSEGYSQKKTFFFFFSSFKDYIRTKKKKSGDGLDLLAALAGGLGFCLLSLADDVHGHRL